VSFFTDTSNYVRAGHQGFRAQKIEEIVSGTVSNLTTSSSSTWWDHGVGKASGLISVQVTNNKIDLSIPVTGVIQPSNSPDASLQDTYGVGLYSKNGATFEYIAVYQL
jgi:hypothetical protein